MVTAVLRCRGRGVACVFARRLWGVLALALAPAAALGGLTPKSPEVEASVERGIKFLESAEAAKDTRIGAIALIGLSLYKQSDKPDHPTVLESARKIRAALGGRDSSKLDPTAFDIYSTGLAIIFLVEVNSVEYRSDIECLLASLRARQKPHGGWGYPHLESGDTSMTQYGALSYWEATRKKIEVPKESIEGVMNWLLRTQDPGGGFGYQGTLGKDNGLVAQNEIRPSMTAAGLGSVYVCSTMLGLADRSEKRSSPLPPGVKEIRPKDEEGEKSKLRTRIDPSRVREAESRANQWLDKNYKIDPPGFTHYYLYALERCMSFKEHCEERMGIIKSINPSPKWYDDGANYLIKTQKDDGSWTSGSGVAPDTAFSVLFLLRSMKKVLIPIHKFGEGTMVGGHGIPKDTSRVEVGRNGSLVQRSLLDSAAKLISELSNPNAKNFDQSVSMIVDLPPDAIDSLSSKHKDFIRQLVGNPSKAARLAAVKTLGKTRDLDNAEALIFALTDPEGDVVRAANEGLLRTSRSTTLVQLPDEYSEEDRRLVIEKWKAWYRAVRPKAELDF
jgi:hypothetical protein